MSTKTARALQGPSLTEIILGIFLSVLIGAALAALWMINKPVDIVRELPKEPVAGKVYYVEGSNISTKGRQWLRKRQLFVEGTSVTLIEDELNAAVASLAPTGDKKPEAAGMVQPGSLNFRIADGRLQIGTPVQVNVAGFQSKVQVSVSGDFERDGDKFVFVPRKFYVGSCPIERLPVLPGMMLDRLFASIVLPDDLSGAWGRLAAVTIEGPQLQLKMP
jgi:hypothetical protein